MTDFGTMKARLLEDKVSELGQLSVTNPLEFYAQVEELVMFQLGQLTQDELIGDYELKFGTLDD